CSACDRNRGLRDYAGGLPQQATQNGGLCGDALRAAPSESRPMPRTIHFSIVLSLLLALPLAAALAQDPRPAPQQDPAPTLRIVRVSEPPQFDDFQDGADVPDSARAASVTGFRQRDPGDGATVSAPTTAY